MFTMNKRIYSCAFNYSRNWFSLQKECVCFCQMFGLKILNGMLTFHWILSLFFNRLILFYQFKKIVPFVESFFFVSTINNLVPMNPDLSLLRNEFSRVQITRAISTSFIGPVYQAAGRETKMAVPIF